MLNISQMARVSVYALQLTRELFAIAKFLLFYYYLPETVAKHKAVLRDGCYH